MTEEQRPAMMMRPVSAHDIKKKYWDDLSGEELDHDAVIKGELEELEFIRKSGLYVKVDRSAAYAARYVAKALVAAGLARKAEVQLSYAIGVAKPVSILVESFGTGAISNGDLTALVQEHFDLRPGAIIEIFGLRNLPQQRGGRFYQDVAAYGHFGREEPEFTWERTDKAAALRAAAGL